MNDVVLQRIRQIIASPEEERPASFELAYKLAKESADGGGDPDKLPWLLVRMFSIFEYGQEPQDVHEYPQAGLREEGVPKDSPILRSETAKTLQRRADGKSEGH
ncbi:hypothetical protein V6C53_14735 [Desulfocurvibacter africanus]|uniref:hypothetical protein n=1 Tax=Desulfocurvibacter africanus TaxID=873 RepID=UPI002FDB2203